MKEAFSLQRWLTLGISAFVVIAIAYVKFRDRSPTPQQIAAGKALFLHEWSVDDLLSADGDGLGPVFNATSCVACHSQGGIGGGGGNEHNVLTFEVDPDRKRQEVVCDVVHTHATRTELLETRKSVTSLFPIIPGGKRIVGGCTVNLANHNPVTFQEVNSPALFGVGVLDEISDWTLVVKDVKRLGSQVSDEFSGKFRHNSRGFTRSHTGGKVGKFGWKGQFVSVKEFVAAACAMELGLTNPYDAQRIPREHNEDTAAEMDMSYQQLDELVAFVKSLPPPQQILPDDPADRERVIAGEQLFNKVQCNDCHIKDLGDAKGVFTDFQLYSLERTDLGNRYSEEEIEFARPNTVPLPEHWKTPALWGVADSAPYFHDGGSATLEEAIQRHHGQASHTHKLYNRLSKDQRKQIVEFLKTLRAPQT